MENLPHELQEVILSEIGGIRDLLHLALTNRYWKGIIIPDHLEYRLICVSNYHHYQALWSHLADNPHLSARIRHLAFLESFFDVPSSQCNPKPILSSVNVASYSENKLDVFPRSFLAQTPRSDPEVEAQRELPLIRALRFMAGLQSFHWNFPARLGPETTLNKFVQFGNKTDGRCLTPRIVFAILNQLPRFRSLSLEDLYGENWPFPKDKIGEESYSLWSMANLTTFVITSRWRALWKEEKTNISALLNRLSRLENLEIDSSSMFPECLQSCKIPTLRRFRLKYINYVEKDQESAIIHFLVEHPSIVDLTWCSHNRHEISLAQLPRLQHILGSDDLVNTLISSTASPDQAPLLSIATGELDEGTIAAMQAGAENLKSLRRLTVPRLPMSLSCIETVGSVLPSLVELGHPWSDKTISIAELDFLASFPKLRRLWGIGIRATGQEETAAALDRVSELAPTMRQVTVFDESKDEQNRETDMRRGLDGNWSAVKDRGARYLQYGDPSISFELLDAPKAWDY